MRYLFEKNNSWFCNSTLLTQQTIRREGSLWKPLRRTYLDKLIIITNTNLLSIACICTKNILAYYVSECPAQSIADTIKEIDTTLYMKE